MKELTPRQKEKEFLHDAFEAIWGAIVKSGAKNEHIKALEMYGSGINGLAIRGNSDLDMTLIFDEGMDDIQVLKGVRQCLDNANKDPECMF